MSNILPLSKNKYSAINIIFFLTSSLCLFRFVFIPALHAYAFLILGIIYLSLTINYEYRLYFNFLIFFPFTLLLSLIFFILSEDNSYNGILYYSVVFNFPFLFYFVTVLLLTPIETDIIISNIKILIKIYILYLFIEVIIRYYASYIMIINRDNLIINIYSFKRKSIAFTDTNFLALAIQNIMCLMLFLENYTHNKVWNKYFIILFLFAVLTLSRSVLITILLLLCLKHIINNLIKKKYFIIIVETVILIFILMQLYHSLVNKDGSFMSKLKIFDGMKKITDYPLNNVLFGFGFGKGEYAYSFREGAYGHSHIAILVGQYGIIGTMFFVICTLYLLFSSKGECFYLLMAFIISGFSLMMFDSSFFWVLGIIIVLSKRKKEYLK